MMEISRVIYIQSRGCGADDRMGNFYLIFEPAFFIWRGSNSILIKREVLEASALKLASRPPMRLSKQLKNITQTLIIDS